MTREEIKNTPELVDFMLDKSVIAESREKLRKRLDEVCNLAIKALEQEPIDNVLDKIKDEICDIDDETVLNPDSFYERKVYVRLSNVINIIDKYKTESEAAEL